MTLEQIGGCRTCGRPWPAHPVEELYRQGWGDAGSLCPTCRSARNARAEATVGRIVSGLADHYAQQWGAGSRKVEIREFPGMAVRSATVVGPGTSPDDMRDRWRELGDGAYLVTMFDGAARINLVVDVDGDVVDVEPLNDDELAMLPGLAQAMNEEDDHRDPVRS